MYLTKAKSFLETPSFQKRKLKNILISNTLKKIIFFVLLRLNRKFLLVITKYFFLSLIKKQIKNIIISTLSKLLKLNKTKNITDNKKN